MASTTCSAARRNGARSSTISPPAGHTGRWLAAPGILLLMAATMDAALVLPAARHVELNSCGVGAYLAVWLLFGLVVISVASCTHVLRRQLAARGGTGGAAGLELTALKRRCLPDRLRGVMSEASGA